MLKRKKILTFVLCCFFLQSGNTYAQNLNLNEFQSTTFSDLAKVSGQVLGSGLFHRGGVHKFGSFDIGIKGMIGYIPGDLKAGALGSTKTLAIPTFQANVCIINNIEIGGRLFSFKYGNANKQDVNLASGIIKFKIIGGLGMPKISAFTAFSRLSGIEDFSLKTYTFGGIIGYSIPVISVYAGSSYNIVIMNVDLEPDYGFYPSGFSAKYTERVNHFTAGISLSIAPFTKVNVEYNIGEIQTVTAGLIFTLF